MTSKNKDKFIQSIGRAYEGKLPPFSDKLLDRFLWLVACGQMLLPTYRFKWPQLDWWENKDFDGYLDKFGERHGFNADRRWNLSQLMGLVANISGDTVECGCYKGAGSYLMCSLNAKQKKHKRMHHIFDSFQGISDPGIFDGDHWTARDLAASESEVARALSEYEGLFTIYKGWIPERFREVGGATFAFVHLDVDIYQPTKDSIEFFYPRLSPGGVLLCDDYGFSTCPGATKAVDDFLHDKAEKMVAMSAGGGFMVKSPTGEARSGV